MKKITIVSGCVLAAVLAATSQTYALTFTENQTPDAELPGTPYNGTFTDANLKSGSIVFNNSQYTITGATVDLTILYDAGQYPVSLKIDGITATQTPETSPGTLDFTLTAAQYDYIQAQDGTFGYTVTLDCELEYADLSVTTSPSSQGGVPDSASTAMLLGGVVSALGLIKRKLA